MQVFRLLKRTKQFGDEMILIILAFMKSKPLDKPAAEIGRD
jgi:hypothetical protein